MYATALHEEVFRDPAPSGLDARSSPILDDLAPACVAFRVESFRPAVSDAGVSAGASTVLCVETPGSAGAFCEASDNPLLCADFGPTTPARPAPPSARTTTAPPTNRRRLCSRVEAERRHSPDLSRPQSLPMAPRRIGSSTNRQESAATAIVAATWSICSERDGFCCRPGAVSTMIGQCQR